MTENKTHPKHYIAASATIEPIDVLRYAPFDLGNALKYILRAGMKGDALTDYKKAIKYLEWAKEGWGGDFKLYNEFVYRYGLLLNKFKTIENLYSAEDDNCYSYISTLIELVETKIKELENETTD